MKIGSNNSNSTSGGGGGSSSSSSGSCGGGGSGSSELCKFNVGGTRFITTMSTLQALNQTNFLTTLIENDRGDSVGCIKDEDGYLFIDHSARLFELVLDYLRTGQLTLPVYATRRQVMSALDFYGIPPPQRQFYHSKEDSGPPHHAASSAYSTLNLSSIELTENDTRDATQLLQEWQRRASAFFEEHLVSLSNHVRRSIAEGRDPISVVSFHTAGHQVQGIPLQELKMSDTGSIGPLLWSKRPTMVFLRYLRMLIEEQWGLPAHIKVVNPGQLGEWIVLAIDTATTCRSFVTSSRCASTSTAARYE